MSIAIKEYSGISAAISEEQSYQENLTACLLAKARSTCIGDLRSAGNAARGAAECYRRLGLMGEAQAEYRSARSLLQQTDDQLALGWTAFAYGSFLRQAGEYRACLVSLTDALRVGGRSKDVGLWSYAFAGIAEAYRIVGNYEIAVRMHSSAFQLFKSIGDVRGIVWALEGRAQMLSNTGRFAEARELFAEAGRIARPAGDHRGLAYALKCEGECLASLGHLSAAEAKLAEATSVFSKLNLNVGVAYTAKSLGDVHRLASNETAAHACYQVAIRLFSASNDRRGLGYVTNGLAALKLHEDASVDAYKLYASAAKFFARANVRIGLAQSRRGLVMSQARVGRRALADELWRATPSISSVMTAPPISGPSIRTRRE